MAKELKSLEFYGLDETYTIPSGGGGGVQSVSGNAPDENGNVALPHLQIDIRKLMRYDFVSYNGSTATQKDIGVTFSFIEPNAYNGQSNILYAHLGDMPAVLYGTFKATANADTEYNFEFAYAFSGGYVDRNIANCVVIEPATGKIYRFAYADENTCSVTESTIGESGSAPSGGDYRLIRKIVVDESNQAHAYSISTDENGNPFELEHIYITARIESDPTRSDGYLNINNSVSFSSALSIEYATNNWYVQLDKRGESKMTLYRTARADADNPIAPLASVKNFDGKINSIRIYTSDSTHKYAIGTVFEIYGY